MSSKMKRNSWSSWEEYLNINSIDTLEEFSEKLVPHPESVMKLPLKDKDLYGYCSEHDDFYLVICKICGKSIKPQSLLSHTELRHKNQSTNKLTLSESLPTEAQLKCLPSNFSGNHSNEINISNKVKNSTVGLLSTSKSKLKAFSNKKQIIYIQPYPKSNSANACQKQITNKLLHSPSSDVVKTVFSKKDVSEKYATLNKDLCIKKVSSESSSSTSQTSMTVFLRHSFVIPSIKLCDIKTQHNNRIHLLNNAALSKKQCLSKATILTRLLPEKKVTLNIKNASQNSLTHHKDEVAGWRNIQNNKDITVNGIAYSWNQHSSPFRPLPHTVSINNEQKNSNSFNCSDLTKKFGDIESQVLIRNAAMGT